MRRRGFRVFLFIAVIVSIAVAVLSVREIHVGGLDRDNDGPLGLKLGLDLQGGVMLWYQADLPDEVELTFQEPVTPEGLSSLLEAEKQADAVVAARRFNILGLTLEERASDLLKGALEALGAHRAGETGDATTQVNLISDDQLEVTFGSEVETGDLSSILEALGYPGAEVVPVDQKAHIITGLSLGGTASQALRQVLEDRLAAIDAFETGDGVLAVTFEKELTEADLQSTLAEARYSGVAVEVPEQTQYVIRQLELDERTAQRLKDALVGLAEIVTYRPTINEPNEKDMRSERSIIENRVNRLGTTDPVVQTIGEDRIVIQIPGLGGTLVDVFFLGTPTLQELQSLLVRAGRAPTGDEILRGADPNSLVIRSEPPLTEEETDAFTELVQARAPSARLVASGDSSGAMILTLPPQPDQRGITSLLSGLGQTDFNVSQPSAQLPRFVINTDEALTTKEQAELREALENGFGVTLSFDAGGAIEEAKRLIGGTAELVFKERRCTITREEYEAAVTAQPPLPDPCISVERGGAGRFIDTELGLTGQDLVRAFPDQDPVTNRARVRLEFNNRGRGLLRELTTRIAGDPISRMPIFLDDAELTAPVVSSPILNGNPVIEGGFTRESARTLANQLDSGRLPVPLKLIREDTVDAILGADSLRKSFIAGLIGLGLVLAFMVVYYKAAGLVAATALVVYGVIVLAIFKLLPVTLTLSGIAGLILSIGMAVDANILIFERMKEELRTGRTLASSMEVGFRRAWSAIRDSNVSTIITCLILWWFGSRLGTPVITGLAITLLIGVATSMFTAIMVSRNMLQILTFTPLGKRMALFTPEPRRQPVAVAGRDS